MKSQWTIGLVAAVAVLVTATVIARYWPEVPERTEREAGPVSFLGQIPADSPFVIVGRNTSEGVPEDWNPGQYNIGSHELEPLLDQMRNTEHPSLPLLLWLLEDFLAAGEERGYHGMLEHYGFNPEAAFALYWHGAMPVFRLELNDGAALNAVLDRAEAEADFQYPQTTVGDVSVRTWPLLSENTHPNVPALQLGIVVEPQQLTLSLLTDRDADANRLQRFARQSISESLADTDFQENWGAEFGRSDLLLGFVDYYRLAQALLLPEQNRTGRELLTLFPDYEGKLKEKFSPACRQEYVQLTQGAPRQVFGNTDYAFSEQQIRMGLRSVLRIENTEVRDQLQRLPGFLPEYSRHVDDKLFTAAMGITMDELVPTLSALWRQLVNAPYECDSLQAMQRQLNRANPMMMGMFTAMASGLQGVGLAVYDVHADPDSEAGLDGDALLSFSAKDPESLVSLLTSYAPGLTGQRVPTDGTPVAFTPPFTSEQLYIAIKSQHIVIYRGERATEAANAMDGEALAKHGLTAFGLNLERAGDVLLSSPETMAAVFPENCEQSYLGLLQMSGSLSDWHYSETMNELGWDAHFKMGVSLAAIEADQLPGDYQVSALHDNDCSWEVLGSDSKQEDGSGKFTFSDEQEGCNLFETEYDWQLQGSQVVQVTRALRERETCSDDWKEPDADGFACSILRMDDTGFYCLWQEETDMAIYRYQRQ
ncbi:hypothetical protein [Marinimicrobium sp. ABcell2]|uniref:hypothetical protein n=1 Tax=Marinimicrobium sp. ABcell2 TaxID=3069751 RepID=UPI0027B3FF71|nr:hypothetical protein [Marinimicrobium sp. ABcell2]MDQ2075125.1 hypothetical protein [Marinimicrobium sp. ABcell2]